MTFREQAALIWHQLGEPGPAPDWEAFTDRAVSAIEAALREQWEAAHALDAIRQAVADAETRGQSHCRPLALGTLQVLLAEVERLRS